MKSWKPTLLLITAFAASPASAYTLTQDDFETGLNGWTGKNNGWTGGVIVDDPLNTGNNVLSFSRTVGGGDIFSIDTFNEPDGDYILSFDYLGTCGDGDCGGYVGISTGYPDSHRWLAGTGSASGATASIPDTGQWEHVEISFNTGMQDFHLMLEDFSGSGAGAGDAFFDNIRLTDANGPTSSAVPEPFTPLLMATGLAALVLRRPRGNA